MLKKIALGVIAVVVLFLGYAATRPDTFHIERKARIGAPPPNVFAQVEDFQLWGRWSPWEKMDPGMKKTFSTPSGGVGAKYAWASEKVGEGNMTLTDSKPGEQLKIKLVFTKPWQAENNVTFTFKPDGDATEVTWAMDGRHNFAAKAFGVLMDMDKMVGGDFERGLVALKEVAEAPPKQAAQ